MARIGGDDGDAVELPFTLAERDRRWQSVRDGAAGAGLDCVLVPLCVDGDNLHLSLESSHGTRADSRYLTLLDNAVVILPTDGRPPVVLTEGGVGNSWVPDARAAASERFGPWGPATADALAGLGLARARIGVSGLARGLYTHSRADDGVVNHAAFAEVGRRLPEAEFVDATDVVGMARFVKGAEEIEALRRGSAIAEAGIEAMVEAAGPGIDEAEVYAAVMGRMLELGSEYYNLALVTGPPGEPAQRVIEPRVGRPLSAGQFVNNEVDAVWKGVIAQEVQPIVIGPVPTSWEPVIELHRELYEMGLDHLRPGAVLGELIDLIRGVGARRGLVSDILMHGRGYGNDGPLLTPIDRGDHLHDVVLREGNVFVWKPIAMTEDAKVRITWGGNVEVTAEGGRRHSTRPHGVVAVT